MNTPLNLYFESNPNPHSLKFVLNVNLIPDNTSYDFPNIAEAAISPLAQELFQYSFVERVFMMNNFITITKPKDIEWIEIQQTLKNHIMTFLEGDQPILIEQQNEKPDTKDSEVVSEIKNILDEYVKPAVEQDGGAITFHHFQNKTLTVALQGSCSGCPSSTITLKSGIENLFKKMMPNVVDHVEAIDE